MTTTIAGVFADRTQAHTAVQALLNAGVPADRVGMVAGGEGRQTEQEVGAGDAASTVAAGSLAAIAGISPILLPGIGLVLSAGAAAGAAGITAASGADNIKGSARIAHILQQIGLQETQADAYSQYVLEGQTVVGATVDDTMVNSVADLLHQHGGSALDYRPLEDRPLEPGQHS